MINKKTWTQDYLLFGHLFHIYVYSLTKKVGRMTNNSEFHDLLLINYVVKSVLVYDWMKVLKFENSSSNVSSIVSTYVFSMLRIGCILTPELAAFWHQILLPNTSCIYFWVWFYFIWLCHFLHWRFFAWDIITFVWVHVYIAMTCKK